MTNELRSAEARYRRAFARSELLREQRNKAVREAIAAGWSYSKIAESTGLTKARVGQIAAASPARMAGRVDE